MNAKLIPEEHPQENDVDFFADILAAYSKELSEKETFVGKANTQKKYADILADLHKHDLAEKIKSISEMDVGPVEYRVEPIEYLRGYDRAKKQAIEILKQ